MTIEQKSELNRFVDPSIDEPWLYRWQRLKLVLPIWFYILAFFFELAFFMAWLSNKPLPDALFVSVGPWLAIFLLFAILWEILVRLGHRSKRVLQFQADKVILGPGKSPCVAWKDVSKIQFEPIAASNNLTKLILTRLRPRKKHRQTNDMLVIENPVQAQELIDYLRKQKAETSTNFGIVVLDAPSPRHPLPNLFWSMSIFFMGLFLIYHGAPILMALSSLSGHKSDDDSRFTSEQRAKLGHFLAQHFSSKAELHHFFLTLSISLIVAGVALLILGWRLMNRKTQVAPA